MVSGQIPRTDLSKYHLQTRKKKVFILRSLVALKNNTDNIGISISEDLTIAERAVLKEWVDKSKIS